jgi:hypothetical protein
VLRKEQVYPHLRSNHQIVYNYLTGSLISPIIQRFHDGSRVEITVDTSLNGIQREAFDQYLVYKTFEKNQANDLATIPIEIEHADSKNEPCIYDEEDVKISWPQLLYTLPHKHWIDTAMTEIPKKIYHGCKKPETGGDCRPGNLQPDGIHHRRQRDF